MRIVYLGTPADAVAPLRALHAAGFDIAFVVTQPDRRRRRGPGSDPSPVKSAAVELGLAVRTPRRAREVVDDLRESGAELGVVVAFGQLLPPAVLDSLPGGYVNVHFSLLPRWRGAAPVERAILAGDGETGVCLMRIEEGLDTGPVYACARVPIGSDETAGDLHARLVTLGTELLLEHLPGIPEQQPVPQAGEPTYAEKLGVEEFHIAWDHPAEELLRAIRAANPRPGAWTTVRGSRLKIWRAHLADEAGSLAPPGSLLGDGRVSTGDRPIVVTELQPEGRRRMPLEAWLAGHRHVTGFDAT